MNSGELYQLVSVLQMVCDRLAECADQMDWADAQERKVRRKTKRSKSKAK